MEVGEALGGKYRLRARLGRGGMGEVWAAHDERLRRDVAVKIVLAALGAEPRLAVSLRQEARTVAALQHAGITVVHDVGETADGHPYFVMELLDGRTFEQLLKEHPHGLPVDRVAGLMTLVADALAYAHDRGVVHRDIKPANLMHLSGNTAKVLDFGIASYAEATARMSATGVVMGSPPFMSPEVWLGETAAPPADMYAFGATLHVLLTGGLPFPGPTSAAWMRQHLDAPPPRPAGVPGELSDLIQQLLAKQPGQRPSAAGAREILARYREAPGRPNRPPDIEQDPAPELPATLPGTLPGTLPATVAAAVGSAGREFSGRAPRRLVQKDMAKGGSAMAATGLFVAGVPPWSAQGTPDAVVAWAACGGIGSVLTLAGFTFLWFAFSRQPLSLTVDPGGILVSVRSRGSRAQLQIPWADVAHISVVDGRLAGDSMVATDGRAADQAVVIRTPRGAWRRSEVLQEGSFELAPKVLPKPVKTASGRRLARVTGCYQVATVDESGLDEASLRATLRELGVEHLYCAEETFWTAAEAADKTEKAKRRKPRAEPRA